MSSEIPKKFMTKDPFIFKPTDYPQVESEQARELVSLALHELEQVALMLDAVGGGT